jgi:hypothetical protein
MLWASTDISEERNASIFRVAEDIEEVAARMWADLNGQT